MQDQWHDLDQTQYDDSRCGAVASPWSEDRYEITATIRTFAIERTLSAHTSLIPDIWNIILAYAYETIAPTLEPDYLKLLIAHRSEICESCETETGVVIDHKEMYINYAQQINDPVQ